jgi:hypothetical protein
VNFSLPGLQPKDTTAYNQKFFETSKMPAGQHKLVVTFLGNSQTTPLTLDYLIVQNGTITNSTTAGGSSGGSNAGSTSNKSNNIGPIVGGVVGGVILIALAIFAFLYIRRRGKRLSEEHTDEPKDVTIEPFQYMPASTSLVSPANHNPSSGVVTYPQVQSGDLFGRPGHGSMPSLNDTEIQFINPSGSSSSLQPQQNHGHTRFLPSSDLSSPRLSSSSAQYVPYNPTGDKAQREAAAIAAVVQPQQRAQQPLASPPLSDGSGSRVILHEDSGIRMTQNEPQVVEVPPLYTPG